MTDEIIIITTNYKEENTMKIAVIAANGKASKAIIAEAAERGWEITGFGRHENDTRAQHYVKKDIMDLTKEDLEGFDAVVDGFGGWTEKTLPLHTTTVLHLADILSGTDTRLLVVGGAGSLYTDDIQSMMISEAPDFPDAYKPVANAMAAALKELRKRNDVKWTYISPAAEFIPDGKRTGAYELHGEVFAPNKKGESIISYADYAIAMADEIEKGNHIRERISVVEA